MRHRSLPPEFGPEFWRDFAESHRAAFAAPAVVPLKTAVSHYTGIPEAVIVSARPVGKDAQGRQVVEAEVRTEDAFEQVDLMIWQVG